MWSSEPFTNISGNYSHLMSRMLGGGTLCRGRPEISAGGGGVVHWLPSCWCWNLLNFDLIYLGDCLVSTQYSWGI